METCFTIQTKAKFIWVITGSLRLFAEWQNESGSWMMKLWVLHFAFSQPFFLPSSATWIPSARNVISSISSANKDTWANELVFAPISSLGFRLKLVSDEQLTGIIHRTSTILPITPTELANFLRLWLCKVISGKRFLLLLSHPLPFHRANDSRTTRGIKQYFQMAC